MQKNAIFKRAKQIFRKNYRKLRRKEVERMNREQAKEYVKQGLEGYLIQKGINTRKPFRCLNPAHNDNKPSMSYDRNRQKAHCFSCGADYDTFDLIGIEYGLTDDAAIFSKGYELFGLDIEREYHRATAQEDFAPETEYQKQAKNERNTQAVVHNTQYTNSSNIEDFKESSYKPDFTEVLEQAHKELLSKPAALQYLLKRGLSMEIIEAYKLGYAEKGHNSLLQAYPQHQSKSRKTGLYKYVFPYPDKDGKSSYFITEITDRTQVDEYNGKYRKLNKGEERGQQLAAQLFNERYLKSKESPAVVFICEGIYDALSVEEVGGKAIALVGVGQNRLLSIIKKYQPKSYFVLCLDNDAAGQTATERLKAGLDTLGLKYEVRTSSSGKDANEALQEDKGAFREYVQGIIAEVETELQREAEQEKSDYLRTAASFNLQSFIDDIEKSKEAAFIPTGFTSVDNILDGGLYAGLYCIGAISSLGKTSFCLQVADNIARAGKDVLIFSLEMARNELIAKSISRLTLLQDLQKNQSTAHAKTTRGILTGTRYSSYSKEERELIVAAIEEYSRYASHIFIHEGIGDIGIEKIRETVEKHKKLTGSSPVVLIDYMQILAPYNERYTDKQNTDKAVIELKRISRDYATAVIGISSFNRENYTAPVNMASFKESGAIEFSADVLIGLQYEGMDWAEGESEKDRNKRVRELLNEQVLLGRTGKAQSIQVKILKNRNGSKGDTAIDFFPMFNYFTDKKQSGVTAADVESSWQPVTEDTETPFN